MRNKFAFDGSMEVEQVSKDPDDLLYELSAKLGLRKGWPENPEPPQPN